MPKITLSHKLATLLLPAVLLLGTTPVAAEAPRHTSRSALPLDLGGLLGDTLALLDITAESVSWEQEGTNAELHHVAAAVGADDLHRRGITGAGIGVALIDTGVADVRGLEDVVRGPDL